MLQRWGVTTPAVLPLAARALAIIRASFRSAVASLARRSAASTSASARILRARSSLAAALANPTSRFISALVNPPRRAWTAPAIAIATARSMLSVTAGALAGLA